MPKLNYGKLNSVQLKSVKAILSQLNSAKLNCGKLNSGHTDFLHCRNKCQKLPATFYIMQKGATRILLS